MQLANSCRTIEGIDKDPPGYRKGFQVRLPQPAGKWSFQASLPCARRAYRKGYGNKAGIPIPPWNGAMGRDQTGSRCSQALQRLPPGHKRRRLLLRRREILRKASGIATIRRRIKGPTSVTSRTSSLVGLVVLEVSGRIILWYTLVPVDMCAFWIHVYVTEVFF